MRLRGAGPEGYSLAGGSQWMDDAWERIRWRRIRARRLRSLLTALAVFTAFLLLLAFMPGLSALRDSLAPKVRLVLPF